MVPEEGIPKLERSQIAIARNFAQDRKRSHKSLSCSGTSTGILKSARSKAETGRLDDGTVSLAQSDNTILMDDIASKNIEIGTLKEQIYNLKKQLNQVN